MASKGSYCEMCAHKGRKADMIVYNNKYFCSLSCKIWYIETYESEEVKPINE